jgi:flagellin
MIIQNNNLANKSVIPYQKNVGNLARSAARLSTGHKFASASDGTGELGVAHGMKVKHKGTNALLAGMQNGQSVAQSQDEAMTGVEDIITRMMELASGAVDPTKGTTDRAILEAEFRALDSEVADIAANTNYNGSLLFQTARTVRIGVETAETVTLSAVNLSNLSFNTLSVSTVTTASAAIISLQARADSLAALRVRSRGHAARLERSLSYTQDYAANLSNAESAIKDVDVAKESGEFTKAQVTVAASQAVLAQANGLTQGALQFLNF